MNDLNRLLEVLIVDDSVEDCLFLTTVLRRNPGLKLTATLHDGQEAIDYLCDCEQMRPRKPPFPNVMFLDLDMPRRNGLEVLAWLKKQKHRPNVIAVLTGQSDPGLKQKAFELGANFVETKPTSIDGLSHLVDGIVRSAAAQPPVRAGARSI